MIGRGRWSAVLAAGALCLGMTSCTSGSADAELLVSWSDDEENFLWIPAGNAPELMTSADEAEDWVPHRTTKGRWINLEMLDETMVPALEEHFLVAASHSGCTDVDGIHLEEIAGEHVVRVDFSEGSEDEDCSDTPAGTQVWQIAQDDLDGQPPAAAVASSGAGTGMPDSLSVGSQVWSGGLTLTTTEAEIAERLPEAFTRLHSAPEHLDELADTIEEFLEHDVTADIVREADPSAASYALVFYDTCGGSRVEMHITTDTEPPVLQVSNTFNPEVECETPNPTLAVWEVPDIVVGEGPQVEHHNIHVDQ